jgi:Concanavalin A-like lectin/glucanases superfamily
MVTSVYDPAKSTFSLFVDGTQVATSKAPQELMQVQTPPYIGTDEETMDAAPPASVGGSFDIDELAIYNKALPANQIDEMYQAEKPN